MLLLMATIEQEAHTVRQGLDGLLEQCIAQMATGQTEALERIYTATKSSVYGFALSIVRNRDDAEDVMQETYVRLHHSAHQYRPQGKPMAWILTIVRNLALMRLREGQRMVDAPEEEWQMPASDDFTESSLDSMVLQTAIGCLGDEEWQIVALHSLSGLKHREIAQLLGLPLSTTLSKYRRALAKLQKNLKEVRP